MSTITLLTGGARSGKSAHSLVLAQPYARRAFVATAEAFDEEMRVRIERHQEERAGEYLTVEAPVHLAEAIIGLAGQVDVAIVDCLTVWQANLMYHRGAEAESYEEVESLLQLLASPPFDLILVTNEVGLGIVPENALARRYRDLLGRLNQQVAARADTVIFMVSGLPMVIKG